MSVALMLIVVGAVTVLLGVGYLTRSDSAREGRRTPGFWLALLMAVAGVLLTVVGAYRLGRQDL